MTLDEICRLLEGEFLSGQAKRGEEVSIVGATDLMSDALAYMKPKSLLLTGLANIQVVRTAEMADLKAVCFVRGKQLEASVIEEARSEELPLMRTPFPMFKACGILWQKGLNPCF